MPRTPDRFPGEREDEGVVLRDQGPAGLGNGDPTVEGGIRYVTDQFRLRDGFGIFNGRSIYVSASAAPTVTDDAAAGFSAGMLWLRVSTGVLYVCQDTANGAASWTSVVKNGDRGDITVSGDGLNWTVDDDSISNAKAANVPSPSLKGRTTAGAGDPQDLTLVNSTSASWNTATGGSLSVVRAALTGDVTAPSNSNTTTIANNAVSNAKAADMASPRLKGRTSTNSGDPEDLTLANSASITWNTGTGGALSVERAPLTGDVTAAANSNATTIANDAVTNAKAANMAGNSVKVNPTAVSADPQDVVVGPNSVLARVGADNLASVTPGSSQVLASDATGNLAFRNAADVSLEGPAGPQGEVGPTGPTGADGATGPQGERGLYGGAVTIPYVFSAVTGTAGTGMGPGMLRLSTSPQNQAGYALVAVVDADGGDRQTLIESFAESTTNSNKGALRIVHRNDPTKWLVFFHWEGVSTGAGFRYLPVLGRSSSAASPFADGDPLLIHYDRTGDRGLTGATGPQGIQGPTGAQGVQGVQGSQGPQGIQGATGAQGTWGGAFTVPYVFSTTLTDADPGNGNLRLGSSTQNTATRITADLLGSDARTWTAALDTIDDSTNPTKGFVRLVHRTDASKWLLFQATALATPSGYRNITVAIVASSAASPFVNGDQILLCFDRTGDKGDTGATGAQGVQGIQGVKGDTGDVGPQGVQGPQGVKGDTGDAGSPGAIGPAGGRGQQGPPGDASVDPNDVLDQISDASNAVLVRNGIANAWKAWALGTDEALVGVNANEAYPRRVVVTDSGGNVTIAGTATLTGGVTIGPGIPYINTILCAPNVMLSGRMRCGADGYGNNSILATTLSGSVLDIDVRTTIIWRCSPSSNPLNIYGMQGIADQVLDIANVSGSNTIRIYSNTATPPGSVPSSYRITMNESYVEILPRRGVGRLWYDSVSSLWRLLF